MSAAPASDRSRPWYRHPLGVAYLIVFGLVALAALIATIVPVGGERAHQATLLMILYGALDVMMIVPLAYWAFGRRFFRLTRYPAADLLLGVLLFAVVDVALAVFLFFTCLGVTRD
jgi:hypothetical protein